MQRLLHFSCSVLLVLSLLNVTALADTYTGTWRITPSSKPGQVQLEMRYQQTTATGNEEWEESHTVPAPDVRDNAFTIHSDAGDFHATGSFSGASGAGTWTFVPSAAFARELQRRGVDVPTGEGQMELAMTNFKL